jgi:iron-sulfur cluster assembly protein
MFTITPAATQEILRAAAQSDASGMALRVAARREADGGIEYGMGFDDAREDDLPQQFDGLTVLLGAPSRALLDDTALDFVELAPGRFGFVFAAAPSSGCGTPNNGCGSGGCGGCGSR